jgi:two-component system, OmpR family, KDP operon response regulator KdpE
MRILVLHPDRQLRQYLSETLTGYWRSVDVVWTRSCTAGLQQLRARPPDVVLLASVLASKPGVHALREIRRICNVPVLVLAAQGHDAEQVEALRQGADDYLVERVDAAVLAARIDAVRRRGGLHAADDDGPDFQSGALAMWYGRQGATIGEVPIPLTRLEYRVLEELARHVGKAVPGHVLLDRVWGAGYGATPTYLKVFIYRVRRKLGSRPDVPALRTERRVGYRLDPAVSSIARSRPRAAL